MGYNGYIPKIVTRCCYGGCQMLTKVRSSLYSTAPTRALASLISTVSVEIATRRDTANTPENKATLEVLLNIYSALNFSWSRMDTFCSPETYSFAWDSHRQSLSRLSILFLRIRVARLRLSIVSDLDSILIAAASENLIKVTATEKVLVTISS